MACGTEKNCSCSNEEKAANCNCEGCECTPEQKAACKCENCNCDVK